MSLDFLDSRPLIVAIAGSNGAGKSTFYHSQLADSGLPFINADDLARNLNIGAYEAADVAAALRKSLEAQRESFIFETVLSDPIGDKIQFLRKAFESGFEVALIFIQIDSVETSIQRVSMRAAQGGHDVPDQKLRERFQRTRDNLQLAIESLPHVLVFDNSDLSHPFRLVATYRNGVAD